MSYVCVKIHNVVTLSSQDAGSRKDFHALTGYDTKHWPSLCVCIGPATYLQVADKLPAVSKCVAALATSDLFQKCRTMFSSISVSGVPFPVLKPRSFHGMHMDYRRALKPVVLCILSQISSYLDTSAEHLQ